MNTLTEISQAQIKQSFLLTEISQAQIKQSFLQEYQKDAKEEDGLGIAIAIHYKWDGYKIMRAFSAALEDSNFHKENAIVRSWIYEV